MTLSDLSHEELYEELEKVIRHWQQLDAEWQRRWRAVQALAQDTKGEIGAGAVSVDRESYGPGYIPTLPFVMPKVPSISPDPPSGFHADGGQSGGAGADGEW